MARARVISKMAREGGQSLLVTQSKCGWEILTVCSISHVISGAKSMKIH